VAQFSRVLSTLLVGGIPLMQALDTAADSLGTQVLKRVLQYEFEANRFAYTALLEIRGADPHSPFAAAVADYVAHDLAFIINYYLRRRPAPAADAAHESVLGPRLAAIRSKLGVVVLLDPKTFRFRAFNLLSVPVVHG